MIRRISTKLVLAVLTAVVLPFVAFAFYIDAQMGERLLSVVQQPLLGLAKDLAGQVDYFVLERHQDVEQWAEAPLTNLAIDEFVAERRFVERDRIQGVEDAFLVWDAGRLVSWASGEAPASAVEFENRLRHRAQLTKELDRYLKLKTVYDLLLLVDQNGRLITCNSRHPEGGPLDEAFLEHLFAYDYSGESWFAKAMLGRLSTVDQHVSPLRLPEVGQAEEPAWGHHLGFAAPVRSEPRPQEVRGVLYAMVNWQFVQQIVGNEVVRDAFRGLVEEKEPSPYAWIWASDADTILAHLDRSLYGKSVSRDVGLEQLTEAVRESPERFGLYPEYEFRGKEKNAAFCRCLPVADGGFGWVLGVGIDNDDIYATAYELQRLLLGGTSAVLVLAVFLTLIIARRTTGPIHALQATVRRVAEGDLDARSVIQTGDELAALSDDLNQMTGRLKEQRETIVKAEKDAAWREMARQIAHDIKNPLTPINLSLDLLERARREGAEGSEQILERTMGLIRRQVESLRQIAGDFYEFTGGHRFRPVEFDLGSLLEDVLHLHDAWAVEKGVEVHRDGPTTTLYADEGKLRRVFVNLVSNALEAMSEGGVLYVETALGDGQVEIRFRDTGAGLTEEAREHLFEPYFTTKTEGTGLGLAISKEVVEQAGGTIDLRPSPDGRGTLATVRLPLTRAEDTA